MDHGSSRAPSPGVAAKVHRRTESATTNAYDFWIARKAGRRLPEHELAADCDCPFCGAPMVLDVQPSEDGPVTVGVCRPCNTVCEVSLP